ncbi:hypothetical protein AMTRI_Chr10g8220 [Amborella trichopoda]|uniref:Phosphoglycerate mutase family protein n=1 Tax=Amborella trichopoda TaxID=13333 RepID=U5DF79_AMBTC|nr:uncharacterized protein LOC18447432 isoform X2 [Amborella trichopoda]ERN19058.1 hypothetical protein AMTR_s00061p00089940 [Amborella trichopoda]|eukprot:XP_006857591.1 uncharacterized protein LOC18447432 isoform X2 [Amborella trichopoda]
MSDTGCATISLPYFHYFCRRTLSSSSFCPNLFEFHRRKPLKLRVKSMFSDTEGETLNDSAKEEPVTRRLVLLRHAKSSWKDRTLRDHDRPLSKAGRVDAMNISHKLHRMGWVPELILSSDAIRTRETLQIMQEHVQGFLEAEVRFVASFYSIAAMDGQTAEHLQEVICEISRDEILTIMCMGHNRGWEEAASMLSGTPIELKTCNAALLEASGRSWEEAFSTGLGGWRLLGVVKPDDASEG